MISWRRFEDTLARAVLSACGYASIAVLVGIFLLLATNAAVVFQGGIEMQPLSPAEIEVLGPKDAAELQAVELTPPTLGEILGGTLWRPGGFGSASFGVLAMVAGTFLTTVGAMAIAVPLGLAAAAWLAIEAQGRVRDVVKFGVEMLAAIPSVVVGFLGIQVVAPLIGSVFNVPGLNALNGALLLAIMSLPTIVSLAEDAISSVPRSLVQGSLALGADRWQTLIQVIFPAARSGLLAACMLGMGRAIGETMTVLMATGNAAAMPTSLLDPVRTMTATIAIELGEVAQGTTHYYALFGVGVLLFLITLAINLLADWFARRQDRWG